MYMKLYVNVRARLLRPSMIKEKWTQMIADNTVVKKKKVNGQEGAKHFFPCFLPRL